MFSNSGLLSYQFIFNLTRLCLYNSNSTCNIPPLKKKNQNLLYRYKFETLIGYVIKTNGLSIECFIKE